MADRRCPLCNQPVSEKLFGEITGIWKLRDEQEKDFKRKKAGLDKKMVALRADFEKEKAAIARKADIQLKKAIALKTRGLTSDNAKLKGLVAKATRDSQAKIAAAVRTAEAQHRKDQAALSQLDRDLKNQLKRQKQANDRQTLKAVAEARISSRLQTEKAVRAEVEAAAKRRIEKAHKEIRKETGKESKVLKLALKSATNQMTTVVQNNKKQQVKIEALERQLASKTTPQHEGLLDEKRLMDALKRNHPNDRFVNTGKGGDVLQEVMEGGKKIGVVIYECKRVAHWSASHVEQTAKAKLDREADFGVLVTNAIKSGTTGFFIIKGVIVIQTGGVEALAAILRSNLVAVAKLKLNRQEKEQALQMTMTYLRGPEFTNAMELVIRKSVEMAEDMKKEQREHVSAWKKRRENLKQVYVSASTVQVKTRLALAGKNLPAGKVGLIAPFPDEESAG